RALRLAHSSQTPYVGYTGKLLSLSESCSQNENVPKFSLWLIGSTNAAGRHNHKIRRTRLRRSPIDGGAKPACTRHFQEGNAMKLPHRRKFLHLAAGAAALPALSRLAKA